MDRYKGVGISNAKCNEKVRLETNIRYREKVLDRVTRCLSRKLPRISVGRGKAEKWSGVKRFRSG